MKETTARHDVLLNSYQRWLSDLTSIAIKMACATRTFSSATVLHSQHYIFQAREPSLLWCRKACTG